MIGTSSAYPALFFSATISIKSSSTNFLVWPLILCVCCGFAIFRRAIRVYLDRLKADTTQWQTDRLALELTILVTTMILPIGVLALSVLQASDTSSVFKGSGVLIASVVVMLVSLLVLRFYIVWRGRSIVIKKKRAPLDTPMQDEPFFQGNQWWATVIEHAVFWVAASGGVIISMLILEVIIAPHL